MKEIHPAIKTDRPPPDLACDWLFHLAGLPLCVQRIRFTACTEQEMFDVYNMLRDKRLTQNDGNPAAPFAFLPQWWAEAELPLQEVTHAQRT